MIAHKYDQCMYSICHPPPSPSPSSTPLIKSMEVGPNRDLVADLSASVRAAGLRMGLYHSLREWFHPLYLQVLPILLFFHFFFHFFTPLVILLLQDQKDNCSTTSFVDEIITPTLMQLVNTYKVLEELLYVCISGCLETRPFLLVLPPALDVWHSLM